MLCPKCGSELHKDVVRCPKCGSLASARVYKTASITVSGKEARQGVFKTLTLPQMAEPVLCWVKPGTRNGDRIIVDNAIFYNPKGGTVLIPVYVTVSVIKESGNRAGTLAATLLLLLMSLGAFWLSASMIGGDLSALPNQLENFVEQLAAVEETKPQGSDPEELIRNYEQRPLLHQLSDELLTNLTAIYESAMAFEATVEFPCEMVQEELEYLITLMHTEFPELLQLDNTQSASYTYDQETGNVLSYNLPYVLTRAEYERQYDQCMTVIDMLVADTQEKNDWEKEQYVFEYIAENCTYNTEAEAADTPYGALVSKNAKCDGISLAMKWIMEEMGITCLCITADSTTGDLGHAWNMAELDGAYYNVDVTMDVRPEGDKSPILYSALNVTNEMVQRDYVLTPVFQELLTIPQVTTMEQSYHVRNGSYVTAGGDWSTAVAECFLAAYESDDGAYLQFETQADYEACLEGMGVPIEETFHANDLDSCTWHIWCSDEFRVLYLCVSF